VIEIGCGPGAAAREVANRVGPAGHVLAIDRSANAIAQLTQFAGELIAAGRLTARQVAAEELELDPDDERYDLAFAVRVGAFDGRHPDAGSRSFQGDACSSMVETRSARWSFPTRASDGSAATVTCPATPIL
jgi:SAM-dependent methyltransferase